MDLLRGYAVEVEYPVQSHRFPLAGEAMLSASISGEGSYEQDGCQTKEGSVDSSGVQRLYLAHDPNGSE